MIAKVKEIEGVTWDSVSEEVLASQSPLLLRGIISDWPLVTQARKSNEAAIDYLQGYCVKKPVVVYSAEPGLKGRFSYTDNGVDLNFSSEKALLSDVLQELKRLQSFDRPPSLYVGSTTVDIFLPGFRAENDIALHSSAPLVSLWVGNETTVSAHFDAPNNIACCASGHRIFTVFPPNQISNLYIGPLDKTPSGQSISMVDFECPDYTKFPNFKEALENAQVAELDSGDALFIPSMWWHHVKSTSKFNVLINYWIRDVPRFVGPGLDALKHAILNIRDLPENEKKAWRELFEYYVFSNQIDKYEHIPLAARGCLAPLDELAARQIRTWLLNRLNR